MYEYVYPFQDSLSSDIIVPSGPHWDGTDAVDMGTLNSKQERWGRNIYAAAGGEVVVSRWDDNIDDNYYDENMNNYKYATGNCIAIKITDNCSLKGCFITYMHLRPNPGQLRVGAKIQKGQWIGWLGNSGSSSGPHLHIQIRSGYWDKRGNVVPASQVAIIGETLRIQGTPRGATDYLFRYAQPHLKTGTIDDARIGCTMAILEAKVLGLIGMEEAFAVAYNRMIGWNMGSMYNVVSAKNQFTTYSNNKSLFDSGGYTEADINAKAPGLLNFAQGMLNNTITTTSSQGWAAGYNNLISKAYYFNSSGQYVSDYLYKRTVGSSTHWYGGSKSGGRTK